MSCKTLAQDIDQSITAASNVPTDSFVFTRNATSYQIPFSSMSASLGVTGTLNPVGAGASISILDIPSPGINNIRGLAPSQGITATLDAFNSIAVKTNFVNAGGTAQTIKDTTAAQLGFRGITAGDGILVSQRDNDVLISTTTSTASSNTVIVNSITDLPTAIAGVITLVGGTNYFISSDISTSNRFVLGSGTVISSNDGYGTTLTYTGTGDMFTFVNGLSGVKEIGLRCANGTLFNSSAVTSGNLLLRWLFMYEVKNLGTINAPSTGIYDCFIQLHTGQGFTVSGGSNVRLNMETLTIASTTSATSVFMDLDGATFTSLNINGIIFLSTTAGQVFLTGSASGANLNTDVIGFVSKVTINGAMSGLSTITNNDAGWDFTDNNKIGDTRPIAMMSMNATATTTIATINTPVIVNGVFSDAESSLYTISSAGRITYNGKRPQSSDVTASITFISSSGTNTFEFYVAKNGTPITQSGISREVTSTVSGNISLVWDLPMIENDYIEIWVANTTGTNNVDAVKIVARVK